MQEVAQVTFFENLKEKISNPFLFTYFWVFCSFNYQNILILFYEPLKMSTKMARLSGAWEVAMPIWITIGIILLSPIPNNLIEYYRQVWERILAWCLNATKLKEMVSLEKYDLLKNQLIELKSQYNISINRVEEANNKLNNYKEQFESKRNAEQEELNKLKESLSVITKEIEIKDSELKELKQGLDDINKENNSKGEAIAQQSIKIERLSKTLDEYEIPAQKQSVPEIGIQPLDKLPKGKIPNINNYGPTERSRLKKITSEGLTLLKLASVNPKGKVKVTLSGTGHISVDTPTHSMRTDNHRIVTMLSQDVKYLITLGFLNNPNKNSEYSITKEGYLLAEKIELQ